MCVMDRTARSVAIHRMNIYGRPLLAQRDRAFLVGEKFDLRPRHFDLRENLKSCRLHIWYFRGPTDDYRRERKGGISLEKESLERVAWTPPFCSPLDTSSRESWERRGREGDVDTFGREEGARSVWDFTQRRLNIEVFRWLACTRLWWRLAGGEKVFVIQTMQLRGRRLTDRPR